MVTRKLSQDVVALVHHVQLNQNGWWKKGIFQVLSGLLWRAKEEMTAAQIRQALHAEFSVDMPIDEIEASLEAMLFKGTISETRAGAYNLSVESTRELQQQAADGQAEFERAKAFFCGATQAQCGDSLDSKALWAVFVEELNKAVQQTGADTFNLLTGERIAARGDWLSGFVQRFGANNIENLKAVVEKFFSLENPDGKNYTLRLLTAYFFVEATQLNKRTIESIDAKRQNRRLKLYLDTNFLFSVLGLHDNPANDAALALLELSKSASGYIEIKFLVAPHTVDETQRAIHAALESAKKVKVSQALQAAATSAPLPSTVRKFFEEARNSNCLLSPDDFFGPYLKDLKIVLRGKGIQVDDGIDISEYRFDQRVVDDVQALEENERKRVNGRQKPYEAIEHDVILWHSVNDKRPKNTQSPFEAEAWVVTLDNRLTAFDRLKTPLHMGVPTALFPSSLAQLIQFWVPRTEQLDNTVFDSFKLPLFFREFDREDERVTMKILGALSRFNNIDDLAIDTVREVLVNEALRHRLGNGTSDNAEEAFALVQEEILQKNRELEESLSAVTRQVTELTGKATEQTESRRAAEREIADERAARQAAETQRMEAETKASSAAAAQAAADAEVARLKKERMKSQFLWRYLVAIPVLALVGCFPLTWFFPTAPLALMQPVWPRVGYAIVGASVGLLGAWRAVNFVDSNPAIGDWWVARQTRGVALWLLGFFGGGVLSGYAGDLIKKLLGIS